MLTLASPCSHLIEPLPSPELYHAPRQQARFSQSRYPLSPPKRPLLLCRRLNFHSVAKALSAAFLINRNANANACATIIARTTENFPRVSFLVLLSLFPYIRQKLSGCSSLQSLA